MADKTPAIHFGERSLATVLAALRYWQRTGGPDNLRLPEREIVTDGDTLEPLSVSEIDELCETLNCADSAEIVGVV